VSDEDHKEKIIEEVVEEPNEQEQLMIQKFKAFEKSHRDISYVLQYWDRSQSIVAKPVTPDQAAGPGEDDVSGKKTLTIHVVRSPASLACHFWLFYIFALTLRLARLL